MKSSLKGKEFAPGGANSLLSELTSAVKGGNIVALLPL